MNAKRPNCLSQVPRLLMCSCLFSAKLSIPLTYQSVFVSSQTSHNVTADTAGFCLCMTTLRASITERDWVPLQLKMQNPGVVDCSVDTTLALRKGIVQELWHSLHSPVWNVQWDTYGMSSDHFPPFIALLNIPRFMASCCLNCILIQRAQKLLQA